MADQWLTERLRRLRGFRAAEERIGGAYREAATSWAARVRDAVLRPFQQAGQAPDASAVLGAGDYWQQQLRDRLEPTILDALRLGWAQVTGSQPPTAFDQAHGSQQHLADSRNRMVRTPDEVYREIAAIVADGLNEGQSIPDIAGRVNGALTVTGSENWARRATVVARTEASAAVNSGAHMAAFAQQQDEGAPYDKIWLATADQRTRASHREADGQRVPLGQPFRVGGADLAFPGDPTGPAGEVIQCRCSMLIVRQGEEGPDMTSRQNP